MCQSQPVTYISKEVNECYYGGNETRKAASVHSANGPARYTSTARPQQQALRLPDTAIDSTSFTVNASKPNEKVWIRCTVKPRWANLNKSQQLLVCAAIPVLARLREMHTCYHTLLLLAQHPLQASGLHQVQGPLHWVLNAAAAPATARPGWQVAAAAAMCEVWGCFGAQEMPKVW